MDVWLTEVENIIINLPLGYRKGHFFEDEDEINSGKENIPKLGRRARRL